MQQDPARWVDPDLAELLGVEQRFLDSFTHFPDLLFEAADIVVGDVRAPLDLHRLGAGVCLGFQSRLHVERVVDRDPLAGFDFVGKRSRQVRQDLLVVAVLLDDDAIIGHFLDGPDVQRGGL